MKIRILIVAACLAWGGAADAGEVARARGHDSGIVLFDDRGKCSEGSTEALYLDRTQQVRGCWFERFDTIWLKFEDNDRIGVPKAAFSFKSI